MISADPAEVAMLVASGLFEAAWYLEQNPDVAAAGCDPLDHFMSRGWLEGRSPGPLFWTSWYVNRYQGLVPEGLNPVIHYLVDGWRLGYASRETEDLSPEKAAFAARFSIPPAVIDAALTHGATHLRDDLRG